MKFNTNAPFWQFMNTLARFTALNLVYLGHPDSDHHHRTGPRRPVQHDVRL